jgi:hypothetical protein
VDDKLLKDRVSILEQQMEGLRGLPDRVAAVEVQIVQLRVDMNVGFSALGKELRGEIKAGDEETRRLMRVLHEEVIARIALLGEGRR